ncbi:MAG: DNA-methyltransferase [Candidatus Helarchaeota archaeon]
MDKLGEPLKKEFLVLFVDFKPPLHKNIIKSIKSIEEKFSSKDFFFDFEDSKIIFYLKSIDLQKFKDFIDKLIITYQLDNGQAIIFKKLITKIENIRSYGIRNGKRLYVVYNKERKVQNRKKKVSRRGTYFYANGHNFIKEENFLPAKFQNKIICGDSKKILKKLPDNCIDLIITSPPYNFGLGYDTSEDGINWTKYFDVLFDIFDECIRVLKFGGRILVNIQPLYSDYIPSHHIISNFFMQRKLIWKGEILWEKHNYNCKYTAWGSWKSPSSPYLKYTWEYLEIFCKGDIKKPGMKENIDIKADEFKQWVIAKWDIAPERKMDKYGHPAMFPERLVERALKLFSYQNDIILDPFNGAGTTTFVAKQLGRKFLGIDVSETYCKIAKKRLMSNGQFKRS